jgi:hypothetical protein
MLLITFRIAYQLRKSGQTTKLYRDELWGVYGDEIIEGWLACGDDFDEGEMLESALADAFEAIYDPERKLPSGITLRELGGDDLAELVTHGDTQLGALLTQAEEHDVHTVLCWLALRSTGEPDRWWGALSWPYRVDELIRVLDDPADSWWERRGKASIGPEPPDVAERGMFRNLLLAALGR